MNTRKTRIITPAEVQDVVQKQLARQQRKFLKIKEQMAKRMEASKK